MCAKTPNKREKTTESKKNKIILIFQKRQVVGQMDENTGCYQSRWRRSEIVELCLMSADRNRCDRLDAKSDDHSSLTFGTPTFPVWRNASSWITKRTKELWCYYHLRFLPIDVLQSSVNSILASSSAGLVRFNSRLDAVQHLPKWTNQT